MRGQRHDPASLPSGKTRYPLYRRLGGPLGRSGQVREISHPPEFDPRTVQPIASRYTDYATRPEGDKNLRHFGNLLHSDRASRPTQYSCLHKSAVLTEVCVVTKLIYFGFVKLFHLELLHSDRKTIIFFTPRLKHIAFIY